MKLEFRSDTVGVLTWEPPVDVCEYLKQLGEEGGENETVTLKFFEQAFLFFCHILVGATLGKNPTNAFNVLRAKLSEMDKALQGLLPGDRSKIH